MCSAKGLGEDIYKLFIHGSEDSADSAFDKLISDKVTINFNMFGPFVKNGITLDCHNIAASVADAQHLRIIKFLLAI